MTHDEPWQVYHLNGSSVEGKGLKRADFKKDSIMGASHVWVWRRRSDGVVEVMLQQRATTKRTWPGYYDISAAGHIDVDETPLQSAVREAKEEIGLVINPEKLLFIFSLRTPLVPNEIDHVYLYEATNDFTPAFDDGEVELTKWFTVSDLKKQFENPDGHHLVNQGKEYFNMLTTQIKRL